MTLLFPWLSESTLRLLALSLLHFLWQGAALAALAYVAMSICRSASARYAVGVATLGLMLAAPVVTFLVFRSQEAPVSSALLENPLIHSTTAKTAQGFTVVKVTLNRHESESAPNYFPWLVELWFIGVVLLSLRSAGGILLIERLRRKETTPVTEDLLELCTALQRRMGLTRVVRYCKSLHLDVPAVAGWIRPVVLLPMSAVSGLTEAQLEAVIAHELAHIRRYDALVNLFQVGVETLLFYHPAVWWMGKRVRIEREHCCDDEAVALCGSPVTYAHALTRMAESKAAPQLAMAVNRSPLVARIARLLGGNSAAEVRGAGLSAGVLCLSAALLAGSALLASVRHIQAEQAPLPALAPKAAVATIDTTLAPAVSPVRRAHVPEVFDPEANQEPGAVGAPAPAPLPAPSARPASTPAPASTPSPAPAARPSPTPSAAPSTAKAYSYAYSSLSQAYANAVSAFTSQTVSSAVTFASQDKNAGSDTPKQSYIDSISAAGLTDLTVDELISLKVQGVTADYIKSMKEYIKSKDGKLDVDELIGMKVQGITGDYVNQMKAATGQNIDADELMGLKVQGVTPEYVRQMRELGLKTDADDIIGMKVQGITPEYVKEMRALGLKMDSDDIIGMKVQGVTPDYVKGFNEIGVHPTPDELIGMKVQGVTPQYFKELKDAGFKVDVDEVIGAKVQGVTPDFIAKVRSHGFKDLTLDKLIALKETGVFDAEK
jgi:beta-lactamase regulating signal transducer with metallopeptidase domain